MEKQHNNFSIPQRTRPLGLLLAAALSGPWFTVVAGSFVISEADGSFEAGFTGMASEGGAQLISSFGAYRPTQASQAALLSTEPDAGATQADADFGALRIDNVTIPLNTQHLRLDYNLFTDEPTPSFADDRFSVTLALIGAGGLETLLEVDTFGAFYPGQGTAFAEQTGFLSLIADVSVHAGSGEPVTLEMRLTDVGDGRGNTAVLLDRLEFTTAGEPIACSGFEYLEVGRGQSTSFDGTCSMDTDGTIADYSWAFDDGAVATGPVVQHAYADEGIYQGTLTVTDDGGNASVDTFIVVVNGDAPVADAGGPYNAGEADATGGLWSVTFDGSGSFDDTGIVEYAWDFDASDGIQVDATGVAPTHAYNATGTYIATLTVTDAAYQNHTATAVVTITAGTPPVADPGGPYNLGETDVVLGGWGLAIDGSGSSDDFGIFKYEWDFDASDGIQVDATGVSATHVYNTAGTYDVTLTVTDHALQSHTATTQVTVSGGAPPVADAGGPYTVGEDAVSAGLWSVQLDASGSTDESGIARYEWDFGDGTTVTRNGSADGIDGFSVGTNLYGYDVADAVLKVIATEDNTSVRLIDLTSGRVLNSTRLDRYEVWDAVPGDGRYFKVESDKPVLAYESDFHLTGHSTFIPALHGGGVGQEFIFFLHTTGAFYVFAYEDATVTFYNKADTVLTQRTLSAGSYWDVVATNDTVYRVTSTGRIAMQAVGGDGYTMVPSSTGRGVGRLFYTGTGPLLTGALVAFAHEDTTVSVYDMDSGERLWQQAVVTGEHWYQNGVGARRLRIESTGDVEVWAGDTQGGTDLVDLGDDISFSTGRDGREFYLHTLSDGAVIFAPFENTLVNVDGNTRTLNADEYWHLPGGAAHHITATNPVLIQTIGKAGGFNEEGTYLGGRFTAPHEYEAPGTYTATLTVYDHTGQSNTATTTVTVGAGDPPVADAGPTIVTEVGFPVNLDATASSDDHGILSYQWDYGVPGWSFTQDAQVAVGEGFIFEDGEVEIVGVFFGDLIYFVTDEVFTRSAGDSYTGQIRIVKEFNTADVVTWGLKDTGTSYGIDHFYYGITFDYDPFSDSGFIVIHENGGGVSSGFVYEYDKNYDLRIDVKASGATYFIRETGAPTWIQLYDSSRSSASTFRFGVAAGSSGFGGQAHVVLSDFVTPSGELALPPAMRTDLAGVEAVYTVPGTFHPSMTVTDHALQTATDSTTVTAVVGDAPVANAGGAYNTQEDIPTRFDASASSDDFGVKTYAWDFGDGESLTTRNPWVDHRYLAAGTYTASLSVTDYAGQSTNTSTTVTVSAGPAVACVPWAFSGGLEVPHDTWSGREVTLKGVAWSLREPLSYEWDFGDGSPPVSGTVTDKRAIEAKHTYIGPEGAPFVATLTVTDSEGNSATDSYLLQIRAKSLDVEINTAIDDGLWRLHKDQTPGEFPAGTYGNARIDHGHWDNTNGAGGVEHVMSPTASALLAFHINSHLEISDVREDPYVETVGCGLRYLPHGLLTVPITPQPAGDPDGNGNGLGVELGLGPEYADSYELGPVIDAFVSSGSPDASTFTGGRVIKDRRYRDLVQDIVDVHAFGQYDAGFQRGGWRYRWNGGDNSASGWVAIGLIPAEEVWDLVLPDFVKSENDGWLSRTYNGAGFGYQTAGNGTNTTPAGMIQLAMNGAIGFDDPVTSEDERDARWATAEDFIANNWNSDFWFPNAADDNRFSYYAYFNFLKAMRLAKPKPIVNLHATGLDWFRDDTNGMARRLVDRQSADGAWPKDSNPGNWVGDDLVNAWSVTMLTPTLFVQAPVADAGRNRVWGVDVPIILDGSRSFHRDPVSDIVLYEWDLDGDGVFDTAGPIPTVNHTYSSVDFPQATLPQDIKVQLRVTDNNDPSTTDIDTVVITLAVPPHPPVADIGGGYTARDGVPISLDGSASFDIDPTDFISTWEWDLDNDGTFGDVTGPTPSATFNGVGTHNIGLRVTDNAVLNDLNNNGVQDPEERLEDYAFTTVTVVGNEGPTASANGPYSVDEGLTVALDGSGSTDPTGDALTFFWDFDNDGAYNDATGPNPEYAGVDDGSYPVGLRVTDGGLEDFASSTVTVNNVPPVVDAGPDQAGVAPGAVLSLAPATFTDAGVLDTHSATIDWGDGSVEAGVVSETDGSGTVAGGHSYTVAGDYTVTVTVTDDDGGTDSDTMIINVVPEGPAQTIFDLAARPKSGKVQLTWSHVGAQLYNVYRSISSGGPYALISSTDSTVSTYLDVDVVNGTTYYYVVRSVTDGVESLNSNEVIATPTARARR